MWIMCLGIYGDAWLESEAFRVGIEIPIIVGL